jgi:hypothetical protein
MSRELGDSRARWRAAYRPGAGGVHAGGVPAWKRDVLARCEARMRSQREALRAAARAGAGARRAAIEAVVNDVTGGVDDGPRGGGDGDGGGQMRDGAGAAGDEHGAEWGGGGGDGGGGGAADMMEICGPDDDGTEEQPWRGLTPDEYLELVLRLEEEMKAEMAEEGACVARPCARVVV